MKKNKERLAGKKDTVKMHGKKWKQGKGQRNKGRNDK